MADDKQLTPTRRAKPTPGTGLAPRWYARVRPAWWGVLVLLLITVYFTTTQSASTLFYLDDVLLVCIGALALQVLQGTAGLPSIATAGFLLFGAFGCVFFQRSGVPFPFDIVCATATTSVIGFVAALPALRLRSFLLALASIPIIYIAIFFAIRYETAAGPNVQAAGFFLPAQFSSHGILDADRTWAWILVVLVALMVLGVSRIMRERSGRALRMMREHEHVAPTFGISTVKYKLTMLTLFAAVVGLEGALQGYFLSNVVDTTYTAGLSFQYIIMIVIGGLDSIPGAIIGATFIIVLPVIAPHIIIPLVGSQNAEVDGSYLAVMLYGLIVILVITSSPDGVIGLLRKLGMQVRGRSGGKWLTGRGIPRDLDEDKEMEEVGELTA